MHNTNVDNHKVFWKKNGTSKSEKVEMHNTNVDNHKVFWTKNGTSKSEKVEMHNKIVVKTWIIGKKKHMTFPFFL